METDNIEAIIQNVVEQAKLIFKLIAEEAKLTVSCFFSIIVMLIFSAMIAFSTWLLFLVFIGYEVYRLSNNGLLVFIILFLVNIFFFFITQVIIKLLQSSLFFKATRKQLFLLKEKGHAT